MLRSKPVRAVALVLAAAVILSPAGSTAQTAEKQGAPAVKAPAKAKGGRVPGVITVTNNATLLLAGVEISTIENDPRIVGSIAQGLQPGKSTSIRLRNPTGCEYSVVAVFEDGSEGGIGSVDLCKDPSLRFTAAAEVKRAAPPSEPPP